MRRIRKQKSNKVLAILTSDWHLRESQPVCRMDNFWESQWEKVDYISDLQQQHDCPIIHAGDLFDHWKASPYLLSTTIKHIPDQFYTIYGNHDLPQHNYKNHDKSGVNVLVESGVIKLLDNTHWGHELEKPAMVFFKDMEKTIAVWHTMTWMKELPYPGCPDPDAYRILRKYSQYDLIVTGHNHKAFMVEIDGRILVNPGSITRQDADQMDHIPCVWLYYGDYVVPHNLPIKRDVISREHIDRVQQRNDRIDALVGALNTEFRTSVSFEDNLERFFAKNRIRTSVKDIVYAGIDTSFSQNK